MKSCPLVFFLVVYVSVLAIFFYKAAQVAHEVSTIRWDGRVEWEQQ